MNKIRCINGFQLKVLAIVLMTVDHMGAILFPYEITFRLVGRLAFPIFCFLIVEGVVHTKDIKKYLLRLGMFALISEIPFDWGFHNVLFYWEMQNVFFTLFFGAFVLYLWRSTYKDSIKLLAIFGVCLLAECMHCDYGVLGVFLIFWLYNVRGKIFETSLAIAFVNIIGYEGIQEYATWAILPIALYNGKRGYPMKHFFYVYYPIHIVILGILSYYIS